MSLRVLHVASEAAPYSQSGGLGQVVGALPKELARRKDLEVAVLTPLYRTVRERGVDLEDTGLHGMVHLFGVDYPITISRAADAPLFFFVDCPAFFDRPGLYTDESNNSYFDNAARFALLSRVAVDLGGAMLGGDLDVIHAHDWQTGLAAAYVERLRPEGHAPKVVFTIHNLAFQGVFDKANILGLDLNWSMFHVDGLEFYDQVSFLKAGAAFADAITTVSPTYASEITTPAFGQNLDGFFRANQHKLTGILNGIDTDEWDPRTDPHIAKPYSPSRRAGKRACRLALGERFGIDLSGDRLVCGVVSRLSSQKGPDLIAELAPRLADIGAVLVLLGSGDPGLEHRFRVLSEWFHDNVAAIIGFDEGLAHQVFAGSDTLLMPSRFEPCGLGQLIAMRYGTLPIVTTVGGLSDTVTDAHGFRMPSSTVGGLEAATRRAAMLRREQPKVWNRMVAGAMGLDWSWTRAAGEYHALYAQLCAATDET